MMQWIAALLLFVLGVMPLIPIFKFGEDNNLFYSAFIFYVPWFQFCFTPLFKLVGVYTYYSPMLLGYMVKRKQIDLHSGTGFDYLFVMRKFQVGAAFRTRLMLFHLEGLLAIIDQIESGGYDTDVEVSGTSYFFSERSMAKLGFRSATPSLFYRLNLVMNIVDLCWMYSLSRGRPALPAFWKVKKAVISGNQLIASRNEIKRLHALLLTRVHGHV